MNLSMRIMQIVIIRRILFMEDCIPCIKGNARNRSWRISLLRASIIWRFFINNRSNKIGSTLFLCFCISVTDGRICTHRYMLSDSFCEYPCNDRFLDWIFFLSFHNRSKDQIFIRTRSEIFIRISYFCLKLG